MLELIRAPSSKTTSAAEVFPTHCRRPTSVYVDECCVVSVPCCVVPGYRGRTSTRTQTQSHTPMQNYLSMEYSPYCKVYNTDSAIGASQGTAKMLSRTNSARVAVYSQQPSPQGAGSTTRSPRVASQCGLLG